MSIFGSIMSKIFGHSAQAAPAAVPPPGSPTGGVLPSAATAANPGATSPAATVDVEANLTDMASKSGQQLNWKTSIVDLMKLLNLDSSLSSRKELASELDYTGDTSDSATMNIWLHKQVMQKLSENGGKVPDSLRS